MLLKPFSHNAIKKLQSTGLGGHEIREFIADPLDTSLELLKAQGLHIKRKNGFYFYDTTDKPISETTFCIVDIETNGSKVDKHQIIEIGAVKIRDMQIIDSFESLVQCHSISPHITQITGITTEETIDAPPMVEVLKAFKLFIGDAVFVAHDVKFDYNFISNMLEMVGMLSLLNRSLCTIDLTERTISSYRYGLAYLNKELELYSEATHHRALSDAITTAKLFKQTLKAMPDKIKFCEELIRFSKEAKRMKRPKFDPHLIKEESKED